MEPNSLYFYFSLHSGITKQIQVNANIKKKNIDTMGEHQQMSDFVFVFVVGMLLLLLLNSCTRPFY